jgi:hypothetical protein
MQEQLELTVFITIGVAMASLMVDSSTLIEQDVNAQNMTNASRLTGGENDSSSASVTARLNISSPEPEPEDYPTPSPSDQ